MKPFLTPEQRRAQKKKFWIVPGIAVVRHIDDRPVMSVIRVRNKRVKQVVSRCPWCSDPARTGGHPETPERQFCEKGMLMTEKNTTEGVDVQWIDADGKLQKAMFQVKELKPWKSDDDSKLQAGT